MPEFFIRANSFAAPFVSDTSERYVTADTAEAALEAFAASYSHPCGLYSADVFASADAFHKGERELARWLCNHELAKQAITSDRPAYSYSGKGPGEFEIDGKPVKIEDPKGGRVVAV